MSWLDDLLFGIREIRDATDTASAVRAACKLVGATITDDPTTGATVITIAGGTPLASVVGSSWIGVNAADPANPVISISPAPASTATPNRLVARDSSGASFFGECYSSNGFIAVASGNLDLHHATAIAGSGATGRIKAQSGTQSGNRNGGDLELEGGDGHGTGIGGNVNVKVGADKVFAAEYLGGPVAGGVFKLYAPGNAAGFLIDGDAPEFNFLYLQSSSGPGKLMSFAGSDAETGSNGDGGPISISTGNPDGSGLPGELTLAAGGVTGVRLYQSSGHVRVQLGIGTGLASIQLKAPTGTTVGIAGAAAPPPASPESYATVLDKDGNERLVALYLKPS